MMFPQNKCFSQAQSFQEGSSNGKSPGNAVLEDIGGFRFTPEGGRLLRLGSIYRDSATNMLLLTLCVRNAIMCAEYGI